ncbi:MAG: SRPBCC family protein [Actinomycetes bacterium]
MREHWVHVEYDFNASPEKVFDHLAEHENLGPLFGAKVTRVKDGESARNGVGSARLLKVGPLPAFEETVTQYSPNELIEYRITHGSPLRNHVGIQRFTPLPGGGTHIDYRIRIASNIPGLAPIVKRVLTSGIVKGFSGLDGQLS